MELVEEMVAKTLLVMLSLKSLRDHLPRASFALLLSACTQHLSSEHATDFHQASVIYTDLLDQRIRTPHIANLLTLLVSDCLMFDHSRDASQTMFSICKYVCIYRVETEQFYTLLNCLLQLMCKLEVDYLSVIKQCFQITSKRIVEFMKFKRLAKPATGIMRIFLLNGLILEPAISSTLIDMNNFHLQASAKAHHVQWLDLKLGGNGISDELVQIESRLSLAFLLSAPNSRDQRNTKKRDSYISEKDLFFSRYFEQQGYLFTVGLMVLLQSFYFQKRFIDRASYLPFLINKLSLLESWNVDLSLVVIAKLVEFGHVCNEKLVSSIFDICYSRFNDHNTKHWHFCMVLDQLVLTGQLKPAQICQMFAVLQEFNSFSRFTIKTYATISLALYPFEPKMLVRLVTLPISKQNGFDPAVIIDFLEIIGLMSKNISTRLFFCPEYAIFEHQYSGLRIMFEEVYGEKFSAAETTKPFSSRTERFIKLTGLICDELVTWSKDCKSLPQLLTLLFIFKYNIHNGELAATYTKDLQKKISIQLTEFLIEAKRSDLLDYLSFTTSFSPNLNMADHDFMERLSIDFMLCCQQAVTTCSEMMQLSVSSTWELQRSGFSAKSFQLDDLERYLQLLLAVPVELLSIAHRVNFTEGLKMLVSAGSSPAFILISRYIETFAIFADSGNILHDLDFFGQLLSILYKSLAKYEFEMNCLFKESCVAIMVIASKLDYVPEIEDKLCSMLEFFQNPNHLTTPSKPHSARYCKVIFQTLDPRADLEISKSILVAAMAKSNFSTLSSIAEIFETLSFSESFGRDLLHFYLDYVGDAGLLDWGVKLGHLKIHSQLIRKAPEYYPVILQTFLLIAVDHATHSYAKSLLKSLAKALGFESSYAMLQPVLGIIFEVFPDLNLFPCALFQDVHIQHFLDAHLQAVFLKYVAEDRFEELAQLKQIFSLSDIASVCFGNALAISLVDRPKTAALKEYFLPFSWEKFSLVHSSTSIVFSMFCMIKGMNSVNTCVIHPCEPLNSLVNSIVKWLPAIPNDNTTLSYNVDQIFDALECQLGSPVLKIADKLGLPKVWKVMRKIVSHI